MKIAPMLSTTLAALAYVSRAAADYYPPPPAHVSVCRDATYSVDADACSGPVGYPAAATTCPKAGDKAVKDCHKGLSTYDEYEKSCIAQEDAKCLQLASGAWGCVFPSLGCEESTYPEEPE